MAVRLPPPLGVNDYCSEGVLLLLAIITAAGIGMNEAPKPNWPKRVVRRLAAGAHGGGRRRRGWMASTHTNLSFAAIRGPSGALESPMTVSSCITFGRQGI